MAQEAWRAYLELAIGATDATRKKATKAVRQLVGKGALSAEQLQSMAEDLLRTSSASRDAMSNLVRFELDKALGRLGLATADEVGALNAKVRDLEAKLREATAVPPGTIEPAEGLPVGAEVVAQPTVPQKAVVKKAVAKKTVAPVVAPAKAASPVKKAVAPVKKAAAPVKKVAKKAVVPASAAGAEPLAPPAAQRAGAEPLAAPAAKKAAKRVAAVRKATAVKKTLGGPAS